jgi:hypothetical protein
MFALLRRQRQRPLGSDRLNAITEARPTIGPLLGYFACRVTPVWRKLNHVDKYLEEQQELELKELLK